MNKILLGSIASAALVAATIAYAQPAPPASPAPAVQPAPPAMMVHMMPPQTRNEVVEKVRAHFAQLDTNRDGYLTKAEGEAGRESMKARHGEWAGRGAEGGHAMMDRGAMFDHLDANHDGAISREEFDRGHEQRQTIRIMRHEGGKGMRMGMGGRTFEQADANNDKRVSLQEATDAALKHFDTADLNHDGTLTPDERQQMHMKMREMHRVSRPS